MKFLFFLLLAVVIAAPAQAFLSRPKCDPRYCPCTCVSERKAILQCKKQRFLRYGCGVVKPDACFKQIAHLPDWHFRRQQPKLYSCCCGTRVPHAPRVPPHIPHIPATHKPTTTTTTTTTTTKPSCPCQCYPPTAYGFRYARKQCKLSIYAHCKVDECSFHKPPAPHAPFAPHFDRGFVNEKPIPGFYCCKH